MPVLLRCQATLTSNHIGFAVRNSTGPSGQLETWKTYFHGFGLEVGETHLLSHWPDQILCAGVIQEP